MLNPTNIIKMFLFWPLVIISASWNTWLYFGLGASLLAGIGYGMIGLTIDALKIVFRLDYENSKITKRKNRGALALYYAAALISVSGGVLFGMINIEKKTRERAPIVAEIEGLKAENEGIESDIKGLAETRKVMSKKMENAIDDYWTSVFYKSMTNAEGEISALRSAKAKNMVRISELESEGLSAADGFRILARIPGVDQYLSMAVFLIAGLVFVEIGITKTAGGAARVFGKRPAAKKKKKSDHGQLRMVG